MDRNLDILFLGGLFPKDKEKEIMENSKGNIQNAANNFQWELINGIDKNIEKPVKILNSLYIGSYPKRYKKLRIETYPFTHTPNVREDINVGFLNLTGIKNFSRYFSLKPYIKEWAITNNGEQKVIIAYAMTSTFTKLLSYAKSINSSIITCLIVPDLPQYMNLSTNRSKIYDFLKNIEMKQISDDMDNIDSYVLLTKYMRIFLNIETPSVIVEGICTDLFENIDKYPEKDDKKTILYSGGIMKNYGIVELVEAFKRIKDDNIRLIICGAGDAEDYIIEEEKKDKRIEFKGLQSREKVLKLQKSSTILVNPRKNGEEYTKYSFPSKLMEYFSSGVPVVAYKLDGVPDEYSPYYYQVDEDKSGLYKTLKRVLSKSKEELKIKGATAKEFVLNNKNNKIQGEKIIQMINGVK